MDPATMAMLAKAGFDIFGSIMGNKGSGDKQTKLSNFDPNQQQYWNKYNKNAMQGMQGYGNAQSMLQKLMDPNSDIWSSILEPHMRQFNEQTIPGLSEQFVGGAEGGALSSSGFGQALGSAGAGLQSNLASQKTGMMQQAMQDYFNQYNQQSQNILGASPFSYKNEQGAPGGNMFGGLTPGVFQNIFGSMQGGGGNSGGGMNQFGGGKTQFPLTNSYDMMFRQQGV